MRRDTLIPPMLIALAGGAAGCAPVDGDMEEVSRLDPVYRGVETRLLEGDLVRFIVRMKDAATEADLHNYAECAAAQYTLIRGYGFARHVRTNVISEGENWAGDAVYTISPSLPQGLRTIDAEVTVQNCAANGIPTV